MPRYWKDNLTLLLTGYCDARCRQCAVKEMTTGLNLDVGALRRNVFPTITPQHDVVLCGGEPTLHPEFEEVVGSLLDRTKHVTVVTNGACAATERKAERFFAFHARNPELGVVVSVDDQHEKGVPHFEQRLQMMVKASERLRIGFKVTEPTYEACLEAIRRFGLPRDRTVMSLLWEREGGMGFGTEKKVFISETGRVYVRMADYLNRKKPEGSIIDANLAEILGNEM